MTRKEKTEQKGNLRPPKYFNFPPAKPWREPVMILAIALFPKDVERLFRHLTVFRYNDGIDDKLNARFKLKIEKMTVVDERFGDMIDAIGQVRMYHFARPIVLFPQTRVRVTFSDRRLKPLIQVTFYGHSIQTEAAKATQKFLEKLQ